MKNILLTTIFSLFLLGCTSKSVLQLDNVYVPTSVTGVEQTRATVEKAILTAAVDRGWSPKVVQPGLIEASIFVRNHEATVDIPYNANKYSIHYKSSQNLNYNGSSIHRNYNNWVLKLSRQIQKELTLSTQYE